MTPQERSNSGTGAIATQTSEYADENEIGVILSVKHDSDPQKERLQSFLKRGPPDHP